MADIFDRLCSVYASAKDNYGNYVDRETGELIQQMSIRDFCMTDRWKPVVDKLRAMIKEHGAKKAKAMPEYKATKELLPGATMSGLFALREVYDEKRGRNIMCSRRTAHLEAHTGFICIDIDLQDNQNLSDMKVILKVLRKRPEVALLMQSCSGTGYFALIPIAYPQYHKEQFSALMREYSALGIVIDRQCSDLVRVRFASYDARPYVNPRAIPYCGIDLGQQMLAPKAAVYGSRVETNDDLIQKVERLIVKLEQTNTDITGEYSDWFRVGLSLANLPEPWGRQFFHRVSAIYGKYNAAETDHKFNTLTNPQSIGIGTFFAICKARGITLFR